MFYVYQYLRKNDSKSGSKGTPFYVGKGTGRRAFVTRKGISVPAERERIQIVANDLSEVDALNLEIALIETHGRIDIGTGILRNRTAGGEGFSESSHSPEANEKRRRSLTGRKHPRTEEWQRKITESLRGGKRSHQSVQRAAEKLRGRKRPYITLALKGKKRPPEVGMKISRTRTGHAVSLETRNKLMMANVGLKASEKTKEKMRAANLARRTASDNTITHCSQGHPLPSRRFYKDGSSRRTCSICRKVYMAAWKAKREKVA